MTETPSPQPATHHVYGIRWELGNRYLLTWLQFQATLSDAEVLEQVRLYANLSLAKVTKVFRKGGPNLLSDSRDVPPQDPDRIDPNSHNPYRAIKAFIGHKRHAWEGGGNPFTVKVPWVKNDAMCDLFTLLKVQAIIGPDGKRPTENLGTGESPQRKHNASL